MKKILFTLIAMLAMATQANAMSYEQARSEALFLTDKMAYELNLSDAQYEAAYEINLDYLMSVTGRSNVFGGCWERRNADIQYILYSWQWELFRAASYFFRPLYWDAGFWHFGIYARYPHRDYFYFGRPHFYLSYRGGHSWHMNGGHSYYARHHDHYRPHPHRDNHFGMRDGWNRGDYRTHNHGNSSTRITGGHDSGYRRGTGDNDHRGGNHSNGGVHNNDGNHNNGGIHNNDGNHSNGGNHNNDGNHSNGRTPNSNGRVVGEAHNSGLSHTTGDRSTTRNIHIGSSVRREASSVSHEAISAHRDITPMQRNTTTAQTAQRSTYTPAQRNTYTPAQRGNYTPAQRTTSSMHRSTTTAPQRSSYTPTHRSSGNVSSMTRSSSRAGMSASHGSASRGGSSMGGNRSGGRR